MPSCSHETMTFQATKLHSSEIGNIWTNLLCCACICLFLWMNLNCIDQCGRKHTTLTQINQVLWLHRLSKKTMLVRLCEWLSTCLWNVNTWSQAHARHIVNVSLASAIYCPLLFEGCLPTLDTWPRARGLLMRKPCATRNGGVLSRLGCHARSWMGKKGSTLGKSQSEDWLCHLDHHHHPQSIILVR